MRKREACQHSADGGPPNPEPGATGGLGEMDPGGKAKIEDQDPHSPHLSQVIQEWACPQNTFSGRWAAAMPLGTEAGVQGGLQAVTQSSNRACVYRCRWEEAPPLRSPSWGVPPQQAPQPRGARSSQEGGGLGRHPIPTAVLPCPQPPPPLPRPVRVSGKHSDSVLSQRIY